MRRGRAAIAGAVAATIWGLLEPIDQRVFRCGYSDVALLGKLVTRGPYWRSCGFVWHAANGAVFGLVWEQLSRRRLISPVAFALLEHVALFPLAAVVDRRHPARGTEGVPPILTARAFAQAAVRHALFGWVLGRLARERTRSVRV